MEKKGKIIEQDERHTLIEVESEASGCHSCGLKRVCKPGDSGGTIKLSGYSSKDIPRLEIGTRVCVEMSEGRSILLSFLLFIMPLVIILIFFFILSSLGWTEMKAILLSLPMGGIYLTLVLLAERFLLRKAKLIVLK